MKLYVRKPEVVETTTEIGNFCGFTTTSGEKGTLVYTGDSGVLHAILCNEDTDGIPNSSCGDITVNRYKSVKDFIDRHCEVFQQGHVCVSIADFYFFDSAKELHRWLSE